MGCIFSKLFASRPSHDQLTEDDDTETPKVYSWDKREKIDVKNFIVDGAKNEVVGRLPGSVNGQQFIIQNCENCDIYIFDHCATVTVDDCTSCRIFIAAIKTSIFIRDSNNCVIATCCQQFRTRDCKKLDAFLCCVTQPIIESTTGVKFGCFQYAYPQLRAHLESAGLSSYNNNWNNIHDFTPVPGENNFSFISKNANLNDYLPLPTKEPFSGIGLTSDADSSVIPYTLGVKHRPSGIGCLVVIFSYSEQKVHAADIVTSMKEHSLVQTTEMKLSEEQAKRVFGSEKYVNKTSQGNVIMLEYAVTDLQSCHAAIKSIRDAGQVHISESPEAAAREIDCLNNLTEMQMAV